MIEKYEDLYDFKTLYKTSYLVTKGVDWKYKTQFFVINRLFNILQLQTKLKNKNYIFPKYKKKKITERGKEREIVIASLQERVIQKVLSQEYLIPVLSKTLIYDNSATLKNKGTNFARKRILTHLQKYYKKYGNNGYALQIDFKSYFANIDHEILFSNLQKYIKDKEIFELIKYLIKKGEKGLTLGSELSQILAVWFPNKLDHFCKDKLGLKFYARYMDDIYIFHPSKEYLKKVLNAIKVICSKLKIIISKNKTKIVKLNKGVNFLKINYILTDTGHIIKFGGKDAYKREKRRLKKMFEKVNDKKMELTELFNNYKSLRGQALKAHNKYVRKLDNYVKENTFYFISKS